MTALNDNCDFDLWLEEVQAQTSPLALVPALNAVAQRAGETFGARIWFAEVFGGRRWSHIAGHGGQRPTASQVSRVVIDDHFGMATDAWGRIDSQDEQGKLVAFVRRLVACKQARP